MVIKGYKEPKSSFLTVEKDLAIIIDKMLKNERLKRLLYYTSKDALTRDNLTQKETVELIGKNIKIIPKLYIDKEVLSYIIITFNNFEPTKRNPEFRDNTIDFDVICHFDQWQLQDFALRPIKIAAEIDMMFNNTRLTGLGKLEFLYGDFQVFTNEYGGIHLAYQAVHGEEDKKKMPNPNDEPQFLKDFEDFKEADAKWIFEQP